jgi:hypothetical protein
MYENQWPPALKSWGFFFGLESQTDGPREYSSSTPSSRYRAADAPPEARQEQFEAKQKSAEKIKAAVQAEIAKHAPALMMAGLHAERDDRDVHISDAKSAITNPLTGVSGK